MVCTAIFTPPIIEALFRSINKMKISFDKFFFSSYFPLFSLEAFSYPLHLTYLATDNKYVEL